MENTTIGQRIARKRKELGLSQIALGEMMGVSRQSISKWEADAAIPEIDKLIALSRLFRVSVGWLLGVEEEPRSDEPEEDVAEREQLLIGQLTKSRPALPRWLKPLVLASAALSLVGVILGGTALYRAVSYERDAAILSQTIAQLPGFGELLAGEQLEDYAFLLEPYADPEQVDVVFTARPVAYSPDVKAELVIYRGSEELLRSACEWTGTEYYLRFHMEAWDGYSVALQLTTQNGIVSSIPLADAALMNLEGAGSFGEVRVDYADCIYKEETLTLTELHVYIDLPMTYRDVNDPWTRCDLVVLADDVEVGRLDMLNRSAYSRQINFMDADLVDFTSQQQSIHIGELAEGQSLELRLEGEFTTGMTLQKTIDTWTVGKEKLSG